MKFPITIILLKAEIYRLSEIKDNIKERLKERAILSDDEIIDLEFDLEDYEGQLNLLENELKELSQLKEQK